MEPHLPFEDISLECLLQPLKGRKRIQAGLAQTVPVTPAAALTGLVTMFQYTCFTVSSQFIMIGANTGGVYVFSRSSRQFISILPGQAGGVTCLALAADESLVAAGSQQGAVSVHACPTARAWSGQLTALARLDAEVRALCWKRSAPTWSARTVFVGTAAGKVLAVAISKKKTPAASAAITPMLQLDSSVCDMVLSGQTLLVSTLSFCYLCNVQIEVFAQVGTQPRAGRLGACFLDAQTVLCARPGLRLWQVQLSGRIVSTHQMRPALQEAAPRRVVSVSGDPAALQDGVSGGGKAALGFVRLLPLSEAGGQVAAFSGDAVFVLDLRERRVTLWTSVHRRVRDIAACGHELYVQCEGGALRRLLLRQPSQIVREVQLRCGAAECARFLVSHGEVADLCRSRRAYDVLREAMSGCGDPEMCAELSRLAAVVRERLSEDGQLCLPDQLSAAPSVQPECGSSCAGSAPAASEASSGGGVIPSNETGLPTADSGNGAGAPNSVFTSSTDETSADSLPTNYRRSDPSAAEPNSIEIVPDESSADSVVSVDSVDSEEMRSASSSQGEQPAPAEEAIVFRSSRRRRRLRAKPTASQSERRDNAAESTCPPGTHHFSAEAPAPPGEARQRRPTEVRLSLERNRSVDDGYGGDFSPAGDDQYDGPAARQHQPPIPPMGVYGYTPALNLNSEVLDVLSGVVGELRGAVTSGAQVLVRRLRAPRGGDEPRQRSAPEAAGRAPEAGCGLEATLSERTAAADTLDLSLESLLCWLDAVAALHLRNGSAGKPTETAGGQQQTTAVNSPQNSQQCSAVHAQRTGDVGPAGKWPALACLCSEPPEFVTERPFAVAPALRQQVSRLLGRAVLFLIRQELPCEQLRSLVRDGRSAWNDDCGYGDSSDNADAAPIKTEGFTMLGEEAVTGSVPVPVSCSCNGEEEQDGFVNHHHADEIECHVNPGDEADAAVPPTTGPAAGSGAWLADILTHRLFYLLHTAELHGQLMPLPPPLRLRLWRSLLQGTETRLGVFKVKPAAVGAALELAAASSLASFPLARLAAGLYRCDAAAAAELCAQNSAQLTPLDVLYLCRHSVADADWEAAFAAYLLRVSPAEPLATADAEVAAAAEAVLLRLWQRQAAGLRCRCGLPRPGANRVPRPAPALLRRLQAARLSGAALLRARWAAADFVGCLLATADSAEQAAPFNLLSATLQLDDRRLLPAVARLLPEPGGWERVLPMLSALRSGRCSCGAELSPAEGLTGPADTGPELPPAEGPTGPADTGPELSPAEGLTGPADTGPELPPAEGPTGPADTGPLTPAEGLTGPADTGPLTLQTLLAFVASEEGPERALTLLKSASTAAHRQLLSPGCFRGVIAGSLLESRGQGLGAAYASHSLSPAVAPLPDQVASLLCSELGGLSVPTAPCPGQRPTYLTPLSADCPACCLPLRNRQLLRPRGLLVFRCGHAFHAVCLLRRGGACLLCQR